MRRISFKCKPRLSKSIKELANVKSLETKQKMLSLQQKNLQNSSRKQIEYHNLTMEISECLTSYIRQKNQLLKEEAPEAKKMPANVNLKDVDMQSQNDFLLAEHALQLRRQEDDHLFRKEEFHDYKRGAGGKVDREALEEYAQKKKRNQALGTKLDSLQKISVYDHETIMKA